MFWSRINEKVDSAVKIEAAERDVKNLISKLDISDFVGLRDTVAILLMYQYGLRIRTLSLLEETHINIDNFILRLGGDVLKNRQDTLLPIDKDTARLIRLLIKRNCYILEEYGSV